jgi:hypothetical protein
MNSLSLDEQAGKALSDLMAQALPLQEASEFLRSCRQG